MSKSWKQIDNKNHGLNSNFLILLFKKKTVKFRKPVIFLPKLPHYRITQKIDEKTLGKAKKDSKKFSAYVKFEKTLITKLNLEHRKK